jgi:hypothetical protein
MSVAESLELWLNIEVECLALCSFDECYCICDGSQKRRRKGAALEFTI